MNDINQTIQSILALKNSGRNPNAVMQMLIARNPQYAQAMGRLQNMAQGKNPKEFIVQLARQNGVSEENLQAIMQIIGN